MRLPLFIFFASFFRAGRTWVFNRNTLEVNMKDLVEIRWHGRGGQGAGLPHRRT